MKHNTYNLNWLLNKVERKESVKYLFFWGHAASKDGSTTKSCFSQWWASAFEVDGIRYATAEHLQMDEQRNKLDKQIESLERQARAEKQPRRKFELVQEIKKLKEIN